MNWLVFTAYCSLLTSACGICLSNVRICFFPCQIRLDVLVKSIAGKRDNLPILWDGK